MKRIVDTCFGKFEIDGDIAQSTSDEDFYYHIPSDMTDEEIKAYFLELAEFEK